MNRRTFFNSIGAAILGTAIALKIPDSLVPIAQIPELKRVPIPTFAQLNALYDKCREYGEEPTYFCFSRDMLEAVEDMMENQCSYRIGDIREFRLNPNFRVSKFRNAKLEAYSFYSDEMVSCGGGKKYGSQGRLNLLTGEII